MPTRPTVIPFPAARRADVVWIDTGRPATPALDPPLSARQLAEKFGIPGSTLWLLETRGLLAPAKDGRGYGPREQERLSQILRWQRLGFSLVDVEQIFAARDGRAALPALRSITRKCAERTDRIENYMRGIIDDLAELRRIRLALSSAARQEGVR